jgi:hypothetical protein
VGQTQMIMKEERIMELINWLNEEKAKADKICKSQPNLSTANYHGFSHRRQAFSECIEKIKSLSWE